VDVEVPGSIRAIDPSSVPVHCLACARSPGTDVVNTCTAGSTFSGISAARKRADVGNVLPLHASVAATERCSESMSEGSGGFKRCIMLNGELRCYHCVFSLYAEFPRGVPRPTGHVMTASWLRVLDS